MPVYVLKLTAVFRSTRLSADSEPACTIQAQTLNISLHHLCDSVVNHPGSWLACKTARPYPFRMPIRRSVITVGNFDGVHLGHRALIDAARRRAEREDAEVVVATFRRHPLIVLRPEHAPPAIMDAEQRRAALLEAGADRVEWLPADRSVLGLEPRAFIEWMVECCRPISWVEGPDFRFGKCAAGDIALLRGVGSEMGFTVETVEPVEATLRDGARCRVSSSLVRWLAGHGRVSDARLCLGRPFAVRGEVVEGEKRGREIGFPTVNLDTGDRLLPADGVYAGSVELDGREHSAAVSVGSKPTFGERQRAFEAYLLDLHGNLYGRTMEVRLLRWLRDQSPYPAVEPLIEQMHRDVERIRRLHAADLMDAAAAIV